MTELQINGEFVKYCPNCKNEQFDYITTYKKIILETFSFYKPLYCYKCTNCGIQFNIINKEK